MDATRTTGTADVPTQTTGTAAWQAPGPGTWTLDASHVPKPLCAFSAAVSPKPFMEGFRETLARNGSLLEGIEIAIVGGFSYVQVRPLGADPAHPAPPPPEAVFRQLLDTVPALRERVETAERVITERRWRAELQHWDEVVKPRHKALRAQLLAVDLEALDDAALCDHVDRGAEAFAEGWRQHHIYTATCLIPVGDFVVHVMRWTGAGPAQALACLAGASPVTAGAPDELAALVAALEDDEAARALVLRETDEPEQVLDRLAALPAPLGPRTLAWLDVLSALPIDGEDPIGEPGSLEAPGLVLGRLRGALQPDRRDAAAAQEAADRLRATVPEDSRAQFDDLLAEARLIYRLRDERGVYSDRLLGNTARTILLEVGRRLQRRGALQAPAHAVDLTPDEVRSLLLEGRGPSREQVAERVRWRETADYRDMPPLFGPPPSPPVPAAWLPPAAARIHEAFGFAIGAILMDAGREGDARTVHGHGVSPGTYEGRARVLAGPGQLERIEQGDVLITTMTGPAFNLVLPLLGAIVTDRGGLLSHAAIVAREFGLPAVVGCRDATTVVPDGARVRVDAISGTVTVL